MPFKMYTCIELFGSGHLVSKKNPKNLHIRILLQSATKVKLRAKKKVFPCSGAVPALHGSTARFVQGRGESCILPWSSAPPANCAPPRSSCGLFLTSLCPEQVYGLDDVRNSPPQGRSRSHRDRSCAGKIRRLGKYISVPQSPRQKLPMHCSNSPTAQENVLFFFARSWALSIADLQDK